MTKLPTLTCAAEAEVGKNPHLEAWLYYFLTENNIEYLLNPSIVASPAQLRFMVALKENQIYVPCSDKVFFQLYAKQDQNQMLTEYKKAWLFIVKLIKGHELKPTQAKRVLSLCRYRFQQYLNSRMILPSRLILRLVKVVLNQCGILDPSAKKKLLDNATANKILQSPEFQTMLNHLPQTETSNALNLPTMRWKLDQAEMLRLMYTSTCEDLWKKKDPAATLAKERPCIPEQNEKLESLFINASENDRKRILFIPDVAGGFIFDLALIRTFLRQGHEVILALKEFFYFNAPTMWDLQDDPTLQEALIGVHTLLDPAISKNALLQLLREHRFIVFSDGTSEQLNLYRTSVTFARAWKEADLIIAKGRRNKEVLLDSSFAFTRDILTYWSNEKGEFQLEFKPRAEWTHKFSEGNLRKYAKNIIAQMRDAHDSGKSVMFYSAVIGSIPGQTKKAIAIVNTFVEHLRLNMSETYIINPAEHFVEGMDGDDLMYMWEVVQRSGLLDIWRFQTVADIETSFRLLNENVPSVWSGKDSTFSTGCTKEMQIAVDVQRARPEMQIIGPAAEKFFRRAEYGVGKYYDASL